MAGLSIIVAIGVSVLTTLAMDYWKGWSISDDAFGFNKKPLLILIAVDSPFVLMATYFMWGPSPINLGGFLLALAMTTGLFTIMTALFVEFLLVSLKRRRPLFDGDDRDDRPKRPNPSQGLTSDDRRKLYETLGLGPVPAPRAKTPVG